jgi:hypothetical protein
VFDTKSCSVDAAPTPAGRQSRNKAFLETQAQFAERLLNLSIPIAR